MKDEDDSHVLDALDDAEKLVEVWKVLVALTVSLERIGWYELERGQEAAKEALLQYLNPSMYQKIANARYLITKLLESHDPAVLERMEALEEKGQGMTYWGDL